MGSGNSVLRVCVTSPRVWCCLLDLGKHRIQEDEDESLHGEVTCAVHSCLMLSLDWLAWAYDVVNGVANDYPIVLSSSQANR